MRVIKNINDNWYFIKENVRDVNNIPDSSLLLNLPHTWNGIDGQDGDNNYYRNTCFYFKKISKENLLINKNVFLEFEGVNSNATIFFNGKNIYSHEGGYSTFRVNITKYIKDNNIICIACDNSINDRIYPQMADFTFYGGIYRNVNLIGVDDAYFDLNYYGSKGVKITPIIKNQDALINIDTYIVGKASFIKASIYDANNNLISSHIENAKTNNTIKLNIKNVHLWNGLDDPYLYKTKVELIKDNNVIDSLIFNTGCRYFSVDNNKGFYLNGKPYPLRGVCRHQDRPLKGNAITYKEHDEDMKLILEIGANAIRLAHYQHDDYFYDLCDKYGLLVWAEIPYITNHLDNGVNNTLSQMKELVIQNYNHVSIYTWGLSNEITGNGSSNEKIIQNHKLLNDLCHDLDKTRLTTMAMIALCSQDDPYLVIPDLISWNLYMGWYGGNMENNGIWLDNFHKKYPNFKVGLSEYGAEGLNWHSSNPIRGDYSEEYQALFHESLLKQIDNRKYLTSTYVWNMFDFGADRRNEGGEAGINHKGLVSFDRLYKKDSFYIYKAYWSKNPFIHICSKKYIERVDEYVTIKVYSNLKEVNVNINGINYKMENKEKHIFSYKIKNGSILNIKAFNKNVFDCSIIKKVNGENKDYILNDKKTVKNWF